METKVQSVHDALERLDTLFMSEHALDCHKQDGSPADHRYEAVVKQIISDLEGSGWTYGDS